MGAHLLVATGMQLQSHQVRAILLSISIAESTVSNSGSPTCPVGKAATRFICVGTSCLDVHLECAEPLEMLLDTTSTTYSDWFGAAQTTEGKCPAGEVVVGFQSASPPSTLKRLRCQKLIPQKLGNENIGVLPSLALLSSPSAVLFDGQAIALTAAAITTTTMSAAANTITSTTAAVTTVIINSLQQGLTNGLWLQSPIGACFVVIACSSIRVATE